MHCNSEVKLFAGIFYDILDLTDAVPAEMGTEVRVRFRYHSVLDRIISYQPQISSGPRPGYLNWW